MPSNHLILCRPILISPSTFPSIRVFSNELALRIRWPKYSYAEATTKVQTWNEGKGVGHRKKWQTGTRKLEALENQKIRQVHGFKFLKGKRMPGSSINTLMNLRQLRFIFSWERKNWFVLGHSNEKWFNFPKVKPSWIIIVVQIKTVTFTPQFKFVLFYEWNL